MTETRAPLRTVLKALSCCTTTVASVVHVTRQTKVTNLKLIQKLGNTWRNIQEAGNSTIKKFGNNLPRPNVNKRNKVYK